MSLTPLENFARFGVMANQGLFLTLGLLGPVAVTCAALGTKIYQNPGVVTKKLQSAKQAFSNASIKKIVFVIAAISLAGAFPFILLPATFAIPAALIAIGSVALLLKNGQKWTHQVKAAFTPQANETTSQARKRILKNVVIGIGLASLTIAFAVLGAQWIAAFTTGSIWGFASIIPQTKLTLFLEYGALGLFHFYKAYNAKSKGEAAFHIGSGILSFVFPIYYCFFSPASEIRLHHSFLGLLFQLVPIPALQAFGALVTFDSSLYLFSSMRGFMDSGVFRSADFMNIVVNNLGSFVQVLTAASVVYVLAKEFFFTDHNRTVDLRCGKSETELRSLNERSISSNLKLSTAFN